MDKQCTVGFSEENKPFNRFKNIAACKETVKQTVYLLHTTDDDNMIVLTTHTNLDKCQREYINASYIDVSIF